MLVSIAVQITDQVYVSSQDSKASLAVSNFIKNKLVHIHASELYQIDADYNDGQTRMKKVYLHFRSELLNEMILIRRNYQKYGIIFLHDCTSFSYNLLINDLRSQ